jgi:7-cyano-7-deazaguanine synthase
MSQVVILFSGGLDSTVLLYHLRADGHTLYGLGVDYGQCHARELVHAERIALSLEVPYQPSGVYGIPRSSALLKPAIPLPAATADQAPTVVPGRNAVLLSLAASVADALNYDTVAIAANATDHATYPDCRPAFLRTMSVAVELASEDRVRIIAPYVDLPKAAIVRRGATLGVPFADTWSCYRGGTVHCGDCGACAARQAAFREAGVNDPTVYEEQVCTG